MTKQTFCYETAAKELCERINQKGVRLSNGDLVPVLFIKTFIGITRSAHVEFMNKKRETPRYVQRSLTMALMLDLDNLASESEDLIEVFEAEKRK